MDKMHHNMVADGTWLNTNKKDTKIVALTYAIQEVKQKFGDHTKKVLFTGSTRAGSSGKKGGKKFAASKWQTKARCPEWKVTKKGNTIKHKGCKYVWCPKHSSKDGSINSLYMPSQPHNHNKWAKIKAVKTAAFKKCKEEAKKSGPRPDATNKTKPDDALKLALGNKLAADLMTQYHMTQSKAESIFIPSIKTLSRTTRKSVGLKAGSKTINKTDLLVLLIVLLLWVSPLVLALALARFLLKLASYI